MLHDFLTANPAFEVNAGPIAFTAARAQTVHDALQAALDGVGTADSTAAAAKDVRTTTDTALRGDIRVLIGILSRKLTPNDARRAGFGLNAPGAAVTPAAPQNLQNFPALAGQIHATADPSPGDDHYGWFMQASRQTDYVFQTDTADSEALLTGLPAQPTTQLRATAVHPAGESVPSDPVG